MAKINKKFNNWMKSEGITRRWLSDETDIIMRQISNWKAGRAVPRDSKKLIIQKLSKNQVPVESWF